MENCAAASVDRAEALVERGRSTQEVPSALLRSAASDVLEYVLALFLDTVRNHE
jgi:hypothetical protein